MRFALTPEDGELRGWNQGTTIPTIGLVALLSTLLTLILKPIFQSKWKPTPTVDAEKRGATTDSITKLGCVNAVAFLINIIIGPYALAVAFAHIGQTGSDPPPFTNDNSLLNDHWRYWHNHAALVGEIFTGYILHMTVMLFINWDPWAWETLAHHILFFLSGILLCATSTFAKLAGWAISMECSSPPLMIYLVARQVEGWDALATKTAQLFGYSFLFFRCVLYTYGYWECAISLMLNPDLMPLPKGLGAAVMIMFGIGWALQFYWAYGIIQKGKRAAQTKAEHRNSGYRSRRTSQKVTRQASFTTRPE